MPGIKCPPLAIEPDLKPSAEVHGKHHWHADVAKVSGCIAGGDVDRASKVDGEMLEVAADADALSEDIEGGLGGTRMLIIEGDMVVDPVADGLYFCSNQD